MTRNDERWGRALARWIRQPLVTAFGVTRERRVALVRAMFEPEVGERAMYWLRLLLAMGIATLGLVLGSTAVIIGAMLISPLMTPIVELGMGIAVGLPRLAFRSFARVGASAIAVCSCAAAITTLLPFQEVTPPIAERAAPTVLDLAIAILCALMAAFGTATSTSAAATHAAGTAIGIALVPPLCVVGFGVGAGRLDVAGGASLLFVTNFSAIMLFAVLTFVALGFNDFDAAEIGRPGRRIAPLWRVALPAALLAIVFVPLRSALDEVAWEIRARTAVQRQLDTLARDTVQSRVRVARRRIDIELILIGASADVGVVRTRLVESIRRETSVAPNVSVVALSDAESVARALDHARADFAAPLAAPPPPVGDHAASTLGRAWPRGVAGELGGWRLAFDGAGNVTIDVAHIGPPLGASGTELLARALDTPFGARVTIVDHAFPEHAVVCSRPIDGACLEHARALLDDASGWLALRVCATRPGPSIDDAALDAALDSEAASLLLASLVRFGDRATIAPGDSWSARVTATPCPAQTGLVSASNDGADGGTSGDGSTNDGAR